MIIFSEAVEGSQVLISPRNSGQPGSLRLVLSSEEILNIDQTLRHLRAPSFQAGSEELTRGDGALLGFSGIVN